MFAAGTAAPPRKHVLAQQALLEPSSRAAGKATLKPFEVGDIPAPALGLGILMGFWSMDLRALGRWNLKLHDRILA